MGGSHYSVVMLGYYRAEFLRCIWPCHENEPLEEDAKWRPDPRCHELSFVLVFFHIRVCHNILYYTTNHCVLVLM